MNDKRAASEGDPDLRSGAVAGVLVGMDMQTTLALHCGGVLLDAQGRRNVTGNWWHGTAARPVTDQPVRCRQASLQSKYSHQVHQPSVKSGHRT
jgi:hypothetical protein